MIVPGYLDTKIRNIRLSLSAIPLFPLCGATYLIACHCLSSLDLKILSVVAATVISENEFQSCTIVWLNTLFWISSVLWRISSLSLCSLVHRPSALRKNNSGSIRSSTFTILHTWIMSPRWRLKSRDGSLRDCSLCSYSKCFRWWINLVARAESSRFVAYQADVGDAI